MLPVQEWILEFRLGYLGRYWSLISVAGLFISFLLCVLIFVPLIINMTLDPFRYPDHIVMSAIADELALTDGMAQANPPSLPLPTSFDGYKSKLRLNVSPEESSSFSSGNGVGVQDVSWFDSVLVDGEAKSCTGNPALMKTK